MHHDLMRHEIIGFGHFHRQMAVGKHIADLRNTANGFGQPTIDGGRFHLFVGFQTKEGKEILYSGGTQHTIGVITKILDFFDRFVAFVPNFADDLLQDIFHGNDTRRFAVFVHQNNDMVMLFLHILKQHVQMRGFRYKGRFKHGLFQREIRTVTLD